MKKWPNGTRTVHPALLLMPLKRIIQEGYELKRNNISSFDYTGFNIGEDELQDLPSPEERFSPHWLEVSSKFQTTLLDHALMIALQLGIEQGRRLARQNKLSQDIMDAVLVARTNRIKDLRQKLSKYEPIPEDMEFDILSPSNNPDLLIDAECPMSENVDP